MAIPLNIGISSETTLSTTGNLIRLTRVVPPRIMSTGTGIPVIAGSAILLPRIIIHARRRTDTVAPTRRPTGGRSSYGSRIDSPSTDKLEIVVIPQIGTTGVVIVALQSTEFRRVPMIITVALPVGRGLVPRLRRAVRVGVLVSSAVAGRGPVIGRTVSVAGWAHGVGTEGIEVRCLQLTDDDVVVEKCLTDDGANAMTDEAETAAIRADTNFMFGVEMGGVWQMYSARSARISAWRNSIRFNS